MISRTQTGRDKLLKLLRQGVVVMSVTFLAVAGLLGAQVVIQNNVAANTEHEIQITQDQANKTQAQIDRAGKLMQSNAPSDLRGLANLQSALEGLAADRHCSVAEFRSSSEVLPYLTRFAKTNSITGWGQVGAQAVLAGKIHDVTGTLTALMNEDIPFEFDSMEITRDKVDAAGDATVICHVTLRVLVRTAKGSA